MPESFYFPVYSGLLTAQHRERIGPAIWEFLWLISKVTKEIEEEGETWGIVLGGKPVKLAEIAAELGGSERTVKRNIARLKDEGYIETVRAPYGEIYKVRKSKKFVHKNRSAKNGTSLDEREDKNVPSHDERWDKNGTSEDREVPHLSERSAKNVPSNKDIKDIKNIKEEEDRMNQSDFQLIANKFIQRRAHGFDLSPEDELAIHRLLGDNIPIDIILKYIDEIFDEYKPKHRLDYIRSFVYVEKAILDRYFGQKREGDTNGTVHKHRRGVSRSAKEGKSYEQILREAEAARKAWGG
jgi:DNA-binding MarR family transcriptional regulator